MRLFIKPTFVIPFVVFIVSLLFAYFFSHLGNCNLPIYQCFNRWDSGLYLDIAKQGHTLFPCDYSVLSPEEHIQWCGNAGWAPLYPFLIRIFSTIFQIDYAICAWLLTQVFYFLFLIVIAQLMVESYAFKNWLLVFMASIVPGHIYAQALFPMSLTIFCISLLFYGMFHKRFLLAGIAGFFAVLSYSIGFLLIASLGFYFITDLILNKRKIELMKHFTVLILTCLGFVSLLLYDYISTGHWDALFLIQKKYDHHLQNPFVLLKQHIERLWEYRNEIKIWIEIQTLFTCISVIALVIYLFFKSRLDKPLIFFFIAFAMLMWFMPFSINLDVALYRNMIVLTPLIFLLKELKIKYLIMIGLIWLSFSIPMGYLFIKSVLV